MSRTARILADGSCFFRHLSGGSAARFTAAKPQLQDGEGTNDATNALMVNGRPVDNAALRAGSWLYEKKFSKTAVRITAR